MLYYLLDWMFIVWKFKWNFSILVLGKKNRHIVQPSKRKKFTIGRRIVLLPLSRTSEYATMMWFSLCECFTCVDNVRKSPIRAENPQKGPLSINSNSGFIKNSQRHSLFIFISTTIWKSFSHCALYLKQKYASTVLFFLKERWISGKDKTKQNKSTKIF